MKAIPPYNVIYSDSDIVVLSKKSGLLVAADRYDINAPRLDFLAEKEFGRLFAVHRIDKDTSGIVIYARNAESHKNLSLQFSERTVAKTYHALVNGHPSWQNLTVTLPLLPDGDDRHRTVINTKKGKPSETSFKILGFCGPYSWIEACPKTGRTHQIRVHLLSTGLSIVCDTLYSTNTKPVFLSALKRKWNGDEYLERPLLNRLALHAFSIEFNHPVKEKRLFFSAPYPKDLDATRQQLAKLYKVDPLKNS